MADKLGLREAEVLSPDADGNGLGVIGNLPEPLAAADFIALLKKAFGCSLVKASRLIDGPVSRVALCGGSGAEFIPNAIEQGADVYLTADCKYHEFQDADGRIGLIDIDHWISERHAREIFRDILAPLGLSVHISQKDQTPIQILKIN
jgi:putative NIF3 family GTP cyclohydrolase 1 type 2